MPEPVPDILSPDRVRRAPRFGRALLRGYGQVRRRSGTWRDRGRGELHADAEALLLARGSRQSDLWGANYLPGRGEDECIEYTSLINIRPSQGNPSMEVQDPGLLARIRDLTFRLIGRGEPLS